MDITYLKQLERTPNKNSWINESISLEEIKQLAQIYNNNKPFPKALRELLFLAGNYCIVLDYGLNDTQQELQEFVRENMQEENRIITRPFYAIDVYNAGDQFLFVYLDEVDDPAVYQASYEDRSDRPNWINKVTPTLSNFVNRKIERVKKGQNPF